MMQVSPCIGNWKSIINCKKESLEPDNVKLMRGARMHLFCFPFAGGTASFFDQLDPYLPPELDLVKLEYPGHGSRRKEPLCRGFEKLAEEMYSIIREYNADGEPYAMLGYSMGTIAAVEVLCKILEEEESVLPEHVFLAAHEPHTKKELEGFRFGEMDDQVKERTISFGGIPESLIHNRSFWRVYLPMYRADYGMIGSYDFDCLDMKSDIPATVFYSETDTPLKEMKKWKGIFTGECRFIQYEGNHFFMLEHAGEMAEVILKTLMTDRN